MILTRLKFSAFLFVRANAAIYEYDYSYDENGNFSLSDFGRARVRPGVQSNREMINDDKNYEDLVEMMNFYNENWNVSSEYLTDYGCQCRGNLDRYHNGLGRAKDPLDIGCSQWRQCLKCAKDIYGEECTSQNLKYKVVLENGQYQCVQSISTCRRAMCECDLQFAQYMGLRASSWDTKNSGEHSNWQPEEQCLEETGANYHGKCCVNPLTGLTSRYNSLTKCCDVEGLIHEQGQCIGEQTISTDGQSLWSGAKSSTKVSAEELAAHKTREQRTWVGLYGQVYDLTDYIDEHPGGAEAVTDVAGIDGTEHFAAVHNRELLESMGFEPIGVLAE